MERCDNIIKSDDFTKNEVEVNIIISRFFKIILGILVLVVILKAVNIFIIPWSYLLIISVSGSILCLTPLLYLHFKKNGHAFKYLAIIAIVLLTTIFYSFTFVNALLLWILPVGFACLYFDEKLFKLTCFFIAPGFMIGEYFSCVNKQVYLAEFQYIPLHIVCLGLELLLIFSIFLSFTKRAKKMLFNTQSLLVNINSILGETHSTSVELKDSVKVLLQNMDETNSATNQISQSIKKIELDSKDFLSNIDNSNENVDDIVRAISETTSKATKIMNETENMITISSKNKEELINSINEMKAIEDYTEKSKLKVLALAESSKKIKETISLITSITKETNLLSLNASIEAARAGEAGKGFGVVAAQIKKLSNQSQTSTDTIEGVLNSTFLDIDEAVKAIGETYEVVVKGLDYINKSTLAFDDLVMIQKNIADQIKDITKTMGVLNSNGTNIKDTMLVLQGSNESIYNSIINISSTIQQFSATSCEITEYIQSINGKAEDLTKMKLCEL